MRVALLESSTFPFCDFISSRYFEQHHISIASVRPFCLPDQCSKICIHTIVHPYIFTMVPPEVMSILLKIALFPECRVYLINALRYFSSFSISFWLTTEVCMFLHAFQAFVWSVGYTEVSWYLQCLRASYMFYKWRKSSIKLAFIFSQNRDITGNSDVCGYKIWK